jgi:hypothetical protein
MTIKEIKEKLKPFKHGYVAEQVNLSQSYFSLIMTGKKPMSKKTEKQLLQFINKQTKQS